MLPSLPVLRVRTATVIGLALLGGSASLARANPDSIVPSAADPGDPIDFHVRLDYEYQVDRAQITREQINVSGDPLTGITRSKDLQFHQYRHVLTPKVDLGIYHDTWLTVSLPIIIAQARELSLASGVDRANSSTLGDGLLPPAGFDARDPSTPPPGDLVFRGESRSGLDQI